MHMKFAHLAIPAMLLALTTQAHAACRMGTVLGCNINGQPGEKECLETGTFSPCIATNPVQPVTGTVIGKYIVLTVIYAPPGSSGGKSSSTVSYESGSSTGTTTSNSSSFKQDYSISASLTFDLLCTSTANPVTGETSTTCPLTLGGGVSYEYAKNETHSDALDIKKTSSSIIADTGPSVDGIDHNRDQIWLLLRPKYDFTIVGKDVNWSLDPDQSEAVLQYVYVGDLKNPAGMAAGVLRDLQAAGITEEDYPDILDADPLAECLPPVIDPGRPRLNAPPLPLPCRTPAPAAPRFVPTFTSIPYDPPFAQGDPVPTQTFIVDNSAVSTHTDSYESSHKVGFTVQAGLDLKNLLQASLKDENNFTWTDLNTTAASTGSEQKTSLTMGGPAFGYTGPANIAVYYDTLYKTFAFVPFEILGDTLHGVVLRSNGKPRAGQVVTAIAGGIKYRTFTNAKGEYRFPRELSGPIQLRAGNVAQRIPQLEPVKSIDFKF
jgi:hypothetical protein